MRSSSTASGFSCLASATPSRPLPAEATRKPSNSRASLRIRIVFLAGMLRLSPLGNTPNRRRAGRFSSPGPLSPRRQLHRAGVAHHLAAIGGERFLLAHDEGGGAG